MNERQRRALDLLDALLREEAQRRRIKNDTAFLTSSVSGPSWEARPEEWAPDWCEGWHFVLPPCFADALGVRLAERVKQGKRHMLWTQATDFAFRRGYTFCDVPDTGREWGACLKDIQRAITITDASEASSGQGRGVERDPGFVAFTLYAKAADGSRLVPCAHHTFTQDDFVRYLISGEPGADITPRGEA